MKKVKIVILSLVVLFAVSVPSASALAATSACSYGCTTAATRVCGGYDGSYNTIQHGYYNTAGVLTFHAYSLYMGDTLGKCIHGVGISLTSHSHTHLVIGHVTYVCGASDITSCQY